MIEDHVHFIRKTPFITIQKEAKTWVYPEFIREENFYKKLSPTVINPLAMLVRKVNNMQAPEFKTHQQQSKGKSKAQEMAEHDTYLEIIKEFRDQGKDLEGVHHDTKPYKIVRLLYSSSQTLIIEVESDIVEKQVMKASNRSKGSYELLQNELNIAKLICSKSTSNRILRLRNEITYPL